MTDTSEVRSPVAGTGAPGDMDAIVQRRYGTDPHAVLRAGRLARPRPADEEVLVRVRAAGVDRGTWHLMAGLPHLVRLAGYGLRRPKNPVPGLDLAGTVEEVGADVSGIAVGDEVFGTADGSFAQYVNASPGRLAAKPAGISFVEAAAVPVSGLTAIQAVRDRAGLRAGESVLVVGASGGVGSFTVQIAKHLGAEVTGVCSTAKTAFVQGLGADHVIDYTREDFADAGRRFDAVIDIGGNSSLSRLRRALTPRGRLVIVGGEGGGRVLGGTDRQLRAMVLSPFVSQKLGTFISSENSADLMALGRLLESGDVTPRIERTFELGAAADALEHMIQGRTLGKLVLEV